MPSIYECVDCQSDWAKGEHKPGCRTCGGGAMEIRCAFCLGRCGEIWKRAILDSNDYHEAHWVGSCRLPPVDVKGFWKDWLGSEEEAPDRPELKGSLPIAILWAPKMASYLEGRWSGMQREEIAGRRYAGNEPRSESEISLACDLLAKDSEADQRQLGIDQEDNDWNQAVQVHSHAKAQALTQLCRGVPDAEREGVLQEALQGLVEVLPVAIPLEKVVNIIDGGPRNPPDDTNLIRVADYQISRRLAMFYALLVGLGIVGINAYRDVDFSIRPALFGWFALAVVVVVFLHEGLHGAAGRLFGYRPIFGLKIPLVYTTFQEKVTRNHLILIALAPLLILDLVFVLSYSLGVLKLFSILAFSINTIGATGDLWIVSKIIRHRRGTLIQDTMTGVEIWERPGA